MEHFDTETFFLQFACTTVYDLLAKLASSRNVFCMVGQNMLVKTNQTFHYTRRITPKRVTVCGAHHRVRTPRQHSYLHRC